MRLISAQLANYRMHRQLSVDFDRELTVVGGPNEAGKSTIVEAIHRALFFRHKAEVGLDKIRPRGRGATPEVKVTFEARGRTYTLHKVFNGKSGSSAMLVDDAGKRHDGDEAEEELHRILGVEQLPAKGKSNFLMQWSHLWVWQGSAANDPTSSTVLNAAASTLRQRLTSLVGGNLAESERDSATFERVVAAHEATFRDNGDPRQGSDLYAAREQRDKAAAAVQAITAQFRSLELAADSITREDEAQRSHQAILETTEKDLSTAGEDLAEVDRLDQSLRQEEAAARAAADAYQVLADGDREIVEVEKQLSTLRLKIEPQEREATALTAHERRSEQTASQAATSLTQATKDQQEVMAERDLLGAIDRLFTLRADHVELQRKQDQIDGHESVVKELEDQLRKWAEVDVVLVGELDELDRKVHAEKSTLKAIATRIEVLDAGDPVTLDGKTLLTGTEETLTEPAKLLVGGSTVIRITPGGGQSIADVRVAITTLENELATRLTTLGLADVAAARRTLEDRAAAESQRQRRLSAIEALDGEKVRVKLDEVSKAINTVEGEIARKMPAGYQRPADATALATLREAVEDRWQKAGAATQAARASLDDANSVLDEARRKRSQAEEVIAAQRSELQRLQGLKAALEQQHGIDRTAELEKRALEKRRTRNTVDETTRALKAKRPNDVRADVERLKRVIDKEKRHIAQSRERQAEARGQLRQVGTFDLHTAKAEAEAQLAATGRRHAEAEQRAKALDHLRKLFDSRRRAVAARFAEPLRLKVAEYLDALYGSGSQVSLTVTDDGLEGFRVSRPKVGGFDFGFAVLSGGTKEQVAAAARLAMAELLAGEETGEAGAEPAPGSLPMVFDDAFTNSDPERLKAVQRLLDLGARRGLQVIVLSCNPQDYGQLGATQILLQPADFGPPVLPSAVDRFASGSGDDDAQEEDDGEGAAGPSGGSGAETRQVPAGTDESLAAELLSALRSFPESKASNKQLCRRLGWDEETYDRIKTALVAKRRLKPRRGQGGGVELPPDPEE